MSDDNDPKYPLSTPLTVLSADTVPRLSLNWVVHEYNGCEVFPYVAEDHSDGIVEAKLAPIVTRDGLRVGNRILVPGLTGGYHLMDVTEESDGLWGKRDQLIAMLEYGEDDRNAWVCTGLINTRGLEKLKIQSR